MFFFLQIKIYCYFLETYGSSPDDWILNPIELYKSYSNTPRVKCHICRQYGHTGYYCQEQYKPEVCIMCGMQGHNFHNCDKKLCFSVSFIIFSPNDGTVRKGIF